MEKMKVAIVGCGKHPVKFHIPSFKRLKNKFRVIGVYDKNIHRAKKIKNKFKIKKLYQNFNDVLNDKDIDIIDICSPASIHYKQILKSVEKEKKNILVEKPFVTQKKHFDILDKINKKKNFNLICLSQQKFREESKSLKNFLYSNKNKLGKLFRIEGKAIYQNRIPQQFENSFTNKTLSGGGPLIDHGSHIIDLLFDLFPKLKIKKITPYIFRNINKKKYFYNVEDSAFINILFNNNIIFNFDTSYVSPKPKDEFVLNFYFSRGYVTWPDLNFYYLNDKKPKNIKYNKIKLASDNQFLDIYQKIKKNKKFDLTNTGKVVKIIEYCYKNNMFEI